MADTERKALYPGSFDPPTNGHRWVMDRMSDDFDQGLVAVGYNPDKTGRFPVHEREEMLREMTALYSNLAVTSFKGLYQADFAEMMGAQTIVRGIRSTDYGFENDISQVNRVINPDIETVFRIPPSELQHISSSMIMGLVGFEGWQQQVKAMVPDVVFDRIERRQTDKEKSDLAGRWVSLTCRLGTGGDTRVQFEDLYTRYTEAHRYYHGISHISMSLDELDLVRDKLDDPEAVGLALWFHDAIYEANLPNDPAVAPSIRDDEGNSAEFARHTIITTMGLSAELADKVANLILATKHMREVATTDAKYMVDIDLAIFGRSARLYDEYETKIRQEYAWVDEAYFREKRAAILASFLPPSRDSVYQTPFFKDRYAVQARRNLEKAIENLKSPSDV